MKAKPFRSLIRPEDYDKTGNFPAMIQDYCKKTGQPVPETPGEFDRSILESLALKYRQVYEALAPYTKARGCIYIVGGGVKNKLLNQFTANALNMRVVTGASEATAAGSVLCQLETLGEIKGPAERKAVVEASFNSRVFEPQEQSAWDEAYSRFEGLYSK
jgi:sugar (pentulose or hexulose) kinase